MIDDLKTFFLSLPENYLLFLNRHYSEEGYIKTVETLLLQYYWHGLQNFPKKKNCNGWITVLNDLGISGNPPYKKHLFFLERYASF